MRKGITKCKDDKEVDEGKVPLVIGTSELQQVRTGDHSGRLVRPAPGSYISEQGQATRYTDFRGFGIPSSEE